MKTFLLSLLLFPMILCAEEETSSLLKLGWEDLTYKVEFEDPFAKLSRDQLLKLSTVARVEQLQKRVPDRVSAGMIAEKDKARAELTEQGVDIEGLFAARERIKELRMKRASTTNPAVDGKRVELPGYALPLELDGRKVTEFLLVPWVGACIHTPPPPPNQIVYVKVKNPMEIRSHFAPVRITGTLKAGETKKELFLVDGTGDILMSYSMDSAQVEWLKKDKGFGE